MEAKASGLKNMAQGETFFIVTKWIDADGLKDLTVCPGMHLKLNRDSKSSFLTYKLTWLFRRDTSTFSRAKAIKRSQQPIWRCGVLSSSRAMNMTFWLSTRCWTKSATSPQAWAGIWIKSVATHAFLSCWHQQPPNVLSLSILLMLTRRASQ